MTKSIKSREQLLEAKQELAELKKAKSKILEAQSYSIGTSQLTRADLKEISEQISVYENAINDFETRGTGRRRTKRVVPLG